MQVRVYKDSNYIMAIYNVIITIYTVYSLDAGRRESRQSIVYT